MEHCKTSLTESEKLKAFEHNYYMGGRRKFWIPKKGDYYTANRADLELYRIVDEDDENVYTVYCKGDQSNISKWSKDDFLSPESFGISRMEVPDWIFQDI